MLTCVACGYKKTEGAFEPALCPTDEHLSEEGDEITPCCSQYSLCTVSILVTVPSKSTGVDQMPHLSTSVVLHSDRSSSGGCLGSRSSPRVIHTSLFVFFGTPFF